MFWNWFCLSQAWTCSCRDGSSLTAGFPPSTSSFNSKTTQLETSSGVLSFFEEWYKFELLWSHRRLQKQRWRWRKATVAYQTASDGGGMSERDSALTHTHTHTHTHTQYYTWHYSSMYTIDTPPHCTHTQDGKLRNSSVRRIFKPNCSWTPKASACYTHSK